MSPTFSTGVMRLRVERLFGAPVCNASGGTGEFSIVSSPSVYAQPIERFTHCPVMFVAKNRNCSPG
jgi:hypothetical protein